MNWDYITAKATVIDDKTHFIKKNLDCTFVLYCCRISSAIFDKKSATEKDLHTRIFCIVVKFCPRTAPITSIANEVSP